MYPEMSGKEDTDSGSDENTESSDDETGHDASDEGMRNTETDRLEEIQDELRAKENELAEVRDELEPELREKEHEINDLREKLDDRLEDHERRLDDLRDELREEIKVRRSPGGSAHSDRPAKAAGVIIGFVGVLGLLGSLAAAAVTFSPEVTTSLTTEAVLGVAAVSAVLSLVVLGGGWQSYKKQRWYFVAFTAVVASVFVSPLGLPALVLVALAEPSFD
jgi:ElaB/YqjD/DUF883 family membrane-anchored ribosome-binding protein